MSREGASSAGASAPRKLPTVPLGAPHQERGPEALRAYGGSGKPAREVIDVAILRDRIVAVLRSICDPEIPVNIYDLGLIYGLEVSERGEVEVRMTLTAPGCPVAGELVEQVARAVGEVEEVSRSSVELVWDPPWTRERMGEEALLALGLL